VQARSSNPETVKQVEKYALLLHYFHKPSDQQRIYPIVVSAKPEQPRTNNIHQRELLFPTLPSFWIAPTQVTHWQSLSSLIRSFADTAAPPPDGAAWNDGPYSPTPTIIDAALALRTGLSIREIAHSEAAEHDIDTVTEEIRSVIEHAREHHEHAICFLTGVPGSGKTLVGLSLAHLSESRTDAIHFMSGNGPLVQVLQELFGQLGMRDGTPAAQSSIQAKTLIENVQVFAKTYTDEDRHRPPSKYVVIFDEAQRVWDLKQNLNKFKRNYSEPQMLLEIMERHNDWAIVVALVGGGQEINSGEAGLGEWGIALQSSSRNWQIFASPDVLEGGYFHRRPASIFRS